MGTTTWQQRFAVACLGVASVAGVAMGGVNPLAPGLPGQLGDDEWVMTPGTGYPDVTVAGNPASAMCVECHEVNPSDKIVDPTGEFLQPGWRSEGADHLGSHFVMNNWSTGVAEGVGTTDSGGGFPGGATDGPRNGGEYLQTEAWDTGGTVGAGFSKYSNGQFESTVAPTSPEDVDLICESCHNLLTNWGDQLLLGEYDPEGDDHMCVVCHAAGGSQASYVGFQRNGNLPAFARMSSQAAETGLPGRKRHHVLSGETIGSELYNPDGDRDTLDSVMWAPAHGGELDARWCGGGAFRDLPTAEVLVDLPFSPEFRGACGVSGTGTLLSASVEGEIPTSDTVLCTSCHRPHNAQTGAGAFILLSGDGSRVGTREGKRVGLTRQADVGPYTGPKVYGDYVALCVGCHQGYLQ